MKKILIMVTALTMMFGATLTANAAYKIPKLIPKDTYVDVTTEKDGDDTIIVNLRNVDYGGYIAYAEPIDSSICKTSIRKADDTTIIVDVEAKGTGTTGVKIWIDGYKRSAAYVMVNSIANTSTKVNDVKFYHYGNMTGENGEAAVIKEITYSQEKYWIGFDQIDMGNNDTDVVKYYIKCYDKDDNPIKTVVLDCTGVGLGESGYKIGFKLPEGTKEAHIDNQDL